MPPSPARSTRCYYVGACLVHTSAPTTLHLASRSLPPSTRQSRRTQDVCRPELQPQPYPLLPNPRNRRLHHCYYHRGSVRITAMSSRSVPRLLLPSRWCAHDLRQSRSVRYLRSTMCGSAPPATRPRVAASQCVSQDLRHTICVHLPLLFSPPIFLASLSIAIRFAFNCCPNSITGPRFKNLLALSRTRAVDRGSDQYPSTQPSGHLWPWVLQGPHQAKACRTPNRAPGAVASSFAATGVTHQHLSPSARA